MNNMYDILAKINLLEGRGVKPDFPDIDQDGDRTEPISKAAKEMDEAMPAPVVKTDSGFTAQAPKGKQLQTTVPKDRPVSPADVKIKEQGDAYGHRASPTFGHSHSMKPGYDPTFRSPIDSPAGSEIEELEYLMSKGAMTNAEEMRLRSLYNKFGIRRPEDMAKIPQLRQQELERIEKTQAELQRKSAEANVASRDEMERQRAARMGVTPRPQSGVSNDAAFRAAYDRAGRPQPAVREGEGNRFTSVTPGFDSAYVMANPDSPYINEIEELEAVLSGGGNYFRRQFLLKKYGINKPEDVQKLPAIKAQAMKDIRSQQQQIGKDRAARNAQAAKEHEAELALRQAYDRAGRAQPAVREEQELEEAAFQFSPEQEKWLGNANRQDPYILARMPGPKPPISYFTDPEDQAIAQRMNFGQSNLNRIKSLAGAQPGDAEVFATRPGAPAAQARPGTAAPSDISTTAGFRKAYQDAGQSGAKDSVPAAQSLSPNERVAVTPGNRDAMTFSQAFADARAKGEKQFPWRGKQYAVKMAASKPAAAAPGSAAGAVAGKPAAAPAVAPAAAGNQPGALRRALAALGGVKLPQTAYAVKESNSRQAKKYKMSEAEVEEGNEFTQARLAAIKAGKPTFKLNGKVYKVTGDTSDEQRMDEGYVDFMDKKEMYRRISAEVEGRSDDYTVTFKDGSRKRYQELDGRRRVTTLEPVDAPEEQDDEGNVVKRGRGRPKGSKRSLGAKGPSGRSKLMRMEEDYDKDEYDEEGEMAKSQARTIEDAARELQDILDDDENLPEWVQKKIVLAKEYIDSARDYMKANPDEQEMDLEVDDEEFMAEKAVSKAQRAAAGIAYAAKKGDIPKSELRGASKEMADMPAKELKKFAKTKEKGLPEKVREEDKDKEEVDETTVSGSVAVSTDAPKAKKGGMQFGKGVYESQIAESFERKLSMLTEGMNISMSMDENGKKNLTVSATDDDAEQLAAILKMAGLDSHSRSQTCEVCGGHEGMHEAGCDRRDMVEEELANSPDPEYAELGDTRDYGVSGGLNGPKLQSNPNNMADNPLAMRNLGSRGASGQLNLGAMAEDVEQKVQNRLMDLYKRIS